jgi:hypothetical protein
MIIQQVIARRQREQHKEKGKLGNSILNHCLVPFAVDGHLRYGADTQIERSRI